MTTQKMLSVMRKGITKYNLIRDKDKIAVGVSGGKDSVTLLKLLAEYKRFSPEKFDLIAISVDLNFADSKTDFTPIKVLCDELGVEYFIEKTDIGQIVFDVRKESNPCALCSKMRKGALNNLAKAQGCNKVALGHHADDLIDTMMLSLLYEGRLSTFAPKSYLDKMDLTLIRPMVMIKEVDVLAYSKTLPVVKSCCPANKHTKREYVKTLISKIGDDIPNVRDMMFTALTHPERYNLFDKFERDAEIL
ncbi:MAG: tRNA 2-thiocytidine biosynthesis protein TtcA [Clostridiales bacterium]|nr:tRNA 2-thiocytidine biosynthesis protein TtcA [Clostridiales bacterium]